MKQIFTCLFVIAILSYSCQKSFSIDTTATGTGGTGGGGTGGGGGGSATNCKDCEYIPMCDSMVYSYNDTLNGTPSVTNTTLRYVKDSVIGGLTFRQIVAASIANSSFLNCTAGATRSISFNAVGVGGSTASKIDIILLKANAALNTTWTDTLLNGVGQTVLYKSKIIAKGVSKTINTLTFTDVITVETEVGFEVPLLGFTVLNTMTNSYAKGVGNVESVIADAFLGTVIQHRTIKSYFIP